MTENAYPVELVVTEEHRSEYPDPVIIEKGDTFLIGEKYTGSEGWDNWYFCSVPGKSVGWIPAQYIEWLDSTLGEAKEAYSAKELNVDAGEILCGFKELNGWVWCRRASDKEEGWIPLRNVRRV